MTKRSTRVLPRKASLPCAGISASLTNANPCSGQRGTRPGSLGAWPASQGRRHVGHTRLVGECSSALVLGVCWGITPFKTSDNFAGWMGRLESTKFFQLQIQYGIRRWSSRTHLTQQSPRATLAGHGACLPRVIGGIRRATVVGKPVAVIVHAVSAGVSLRTTFANAVCTDFVGTTSGTAYVPQVPTVDHLGLGRHDQRTASCPPKQPRPTAAHF